MSLIGSCAEMILTAENIVCRPLHFSIRRLGQIVLPPQLMFFATVDATHGPEDHLRAPARPNPVKRELPIKPRCQRKKAVHRKDWDST